MTRLLTIFVGFHVILGLMVISLAIGRLPDMYLSLPPSAANHHQLWVHIGSNAFFTFSSEPFLENLSDLLRPVTQTFTPGPGSWLVLIFMFGLTAVLTRRGVRILSLSSTLLTLLSVSLILGNDVVVWAALAWLPPLAWAMSHPNSAIRRGLGLVLALCLVRTGQQLALPVALVSWSWARAIGSEIDRPLVTAIILLSIIPIFAVNPPPFPDYPPLAQVVRDDGLPGMIRPWLGAANPIPFIDRAWIRHFDFYAGTFCLVLGMLAHASCKQKDIVVTSIGLAGLLFLDGLPREDLTQLAPLATLSRVFPAYFFFPLGPLFAAMSVAGVLISLAREQAYLRHALFTGLCVLVTITGKVGELKPAFSCGSFGESRIACPIQRADQFVSSVPEWQRALVVSPSLELIREQSLTVLDQPSELQLVSVSEAGAQLLSSSHFSEHSLAKMTDGKDRTRWSARQGKQDGTEWILIRFPQKVSLTAVLAGTGVFTTDFPRGINIDYQSTCSDLTPESANSSFNPLISYTDWPGPIEYTPKGFPYYGPQSNVLIRFPAVLEAQCLRIRQTGKSDSFDWSVAELQVGVVK